MRLFSSRTLRGEIGGEAEQEMRRVVQVAVMLLFACGSCAESEAYLPWCAPPDDDYSMRIVSDESQPLFDLREEWSVGGAGDEAVFGHPGPPAISLQGDVAVPDLMAGNVVLISAEGDWRGPVLRSGQGPGEVEWPIQVEWSRDSRLHTLDLHDGTVVTVDPDERSLAPREWRLDRSIYSRIAMAGSLPSADLSGDGSVILELPYDPVEGAPNIRRTTVVRVRPEQVDTLRVQNIVVLGEGSYGEWVIPGTPRPVLAVGPEGRVALAGHDRHYRIQIFPGDSDAAAQGVALCRDAESLPYTEVEEGRSADSEAPNELLAALAAADRPDQPAALGGLFWGSGSRLWVLRDRLDPLSNHERPEGGTYEVLTLDGKWVGSVRAPQQVVLVGEGGGRVYGMRRGEYDEVELVAYQLVEQSRSLR